MHDRNPLIAEQLSGVKQSRSSGFLPEIDRMHRQSRPGEVALPEMRTRARIAAGPA